MARTPPYRRSSGALAKPGLAVRRTWLPIFVLAGILLVGWVIAGGLMVVVLEAWLQFAFVLPLLVAAGMLGLALTAPLAREGVFAESGWPDGWRAIMAIGAGLGVLALGTLGLGAVGWLGHGIPGGLLILGAALGYAPTRKYVWEFDRSVWTGEGAVMERRELLLLLACVPLAVVMIAATIAPGAQWASEFGGYDVMEYHLEMPREYMENYSTAPVTHNVYSFLPANVEMLYLLLMGLAKMGSPASLGHLAGIYPAQMLHASMMVLAAGAVALAPVRLSMVGRAVAFVAVLAVPWTVVTGSMAYDEGGVLLFGALALGLVLGKRTRGATVMIGVMLGLAVGSKMTAGVMIALPIGLLMVMQRRWRGVVSAAMIAVLLYMPWAVRAMVGTRVERQIGNPVFPIAAKTLGHGHWTEGQVAQWNAAHGAAEKEASIGGRLKALVRGSVLDSQWSPGYETLAKWAGVKGGGGSGWLGRVGVLWLVVPVAVGLALSQGAAGWELVLVGAAQCVAWMAFTHLQARFLLPAVLPLALLLGMAAEPVGWGRVMVASVVGLQAVLCLFLLLPEVELLGGARGPRAGVVGLLALVPEAYRSPENLIVRPVPAPELPEGIRTYLVGDSRALYYHGRVKYNTVWDRNELAEKMAEGYSEKTVDWLREREKVNYLVVNWGEVRRLQKQYGYSAEVTPERVEMMLRWGLQRPGFETGGGVEVYEVNPRVE